jgi:hypothetical protein
MLILVILLIAAIVALSAACALGSVSYARRTRPVLRRATASVIGAGARL